MSQLKTTLCALRLFGLLQGHRMRGIVVPLVAVAALAGGIAYIATASGQDDEKAAPIFVDKIPDGYRDWKLISVAHEEGNLKSLGAILGNDVAIKAYREGKLPFPEGSIIAALHWRHVPSEENNKIFGRSQSFIAGSPNERPVYGQGLQEIRLHGRLGVRSFQRARRQTWRKGVAPILLSLSPEGQR